MTTTTLTTSSPWTLPQKIAFRFFFLYVFLYTFPFPIHAFDFMEGLVQWVSEFWDLLSTAIAPWFGVEGPVDGTPTGSGDKTSDFLYNFIFLALSITGATIWSFADRKRMSYTTLWTILLILLRYYLAWNMLAYGSYKVFKLQFTFPSLYRLVQAYGDSSPMGLAWTYMGYSDTYTWFAGTMEVIGGALLLYRRTATLGALVSMGVMLNVFMMNMSYDIPVKLFSFNLLLMSLLIALPDVRRLLNVLLLNRPTEPRKISLDLAKKWQRIARYVLKAFFIGYACIWAGIKIGQMLEEHGENAPKPAHYGIYDVEQFVLNSDTLPPLMTDTTRWKRIIVNYPGVVRVYGMSDEKFNYRFEADTSEHSLSLTTFADSALVFEGSYAPLDSVHREWKGMQGEDTVRMVLKRFDIQQFKLVSRGFNWLNEYPYNR